MTLGLVNDLEEEIVVGADEDDENPRQAVGDELVSSDSKWHKHTLKVYSMLRRNMGSTATDDEDNKPDNLSYNRLSKGCSRRTAAGVFFLNFCNLKRGI